MPSRAPLTDEEMQALRDRMERYEAAKSTRTPPQAPSQTFGMRTHSARRTGPRQRYDPQAAAEARHADRMRLAELRKTVEAEKATAKAAQEVKRTARIAKDKEAALRPVDPDAHRNPGGEGLKSGAFYQTKNPEDEKGQVFPYYRTSVAEDYAARQPSRDDRPISSMYRVTPRQYQAAYGVEFTGSDPDSMRRLLALQNGTGSAMDSERSVLDQRSQDAYNSRPANPNPTTAAYTGLAPISTDQMRVGVLNNIQSPEDRRVMEIAERVGGITPESIDAYDRQEKMRIEREGPRPEFTERSVSSKPNSKPTENPPASSWYTGDLSKELEEIGKGSLPKGSILYDQAARRLAELKARYGGR